MSLTAWGVLRFFTDRFVTQNANKAIEAKGLDKVAVKAMGLFRKKPKRYLLTALVVSAHGNRPPQYRASFAASGKNGVFYLQHSMAAGGAGWTKPRKIEVGRQDRFAADMTIDFPIISRFDHEREGPVWFFGNRADLVDGHPRDSLNPNWHFRGRITFEAEDGTEQHCYFIVATSERADVPVVTGEHMFSHVWEWEGRPAPNTAPEAPFRH